MFRKSKQNNNDNSFDKLGVDWANFSLWCYVLGEIKIFQAQQILFFIIITVRQTSEYHDNCFKLNRIKMASTLDSLLTYILIWLWLSNWNCFIRGNSKRKRENANPSSWWYFIELLISVRVDIKYFTLIQINQPNQKNWCDQLPPAFLPT